MKGRDSKRIWKIIEDELPKAILKGLLEKSKDTYNVDECFDSGDLEIRDILTERRRRYDRQGV